ncbi:MAG: hypothetical protein MZV64_71845 [Ignavibacteriales bacterium]|nr:hypothetical protein [Ignavibacteriales bacterium]
MGLVIAILAVFNIFLYNYFVFFQNPTFFISFVVLAIVAYVPDPGAAEECRQTG